MAGKPSALAAARAALKRAEDRLGDPQSLAQLRNALNSLLGVMSGGFPKIEKDIARNLVLSCRNKALAEGRDIVANVDAYETATLEHWRAVMEVFVDAGLGDDPDFNACKAGLAAKRGSEGIPGFTSAELAVLEKELQAALDSLSVHRSRLTNIKWGSQK
jgi:hypothetical protein